MPMRNPVLERLKGGACASCFWLVSGSPAVAELAAEARPDALGFDLQHGLWEPGELHAAIGITREKAVPLVRVAENTPKAIGAALDAGALGVIVPLVETAEQARAAVAAAKYPPAGIRSSGGVRPLVDFKNYVAAANANILVAVMIETRTGVENAAAIAATPGLDMVFIGTGDLAMSLGTFPELGEAHEAAVLTVRDACKKAGIAAGIFCTDAAFAAERRRQGFAFVTTATDWDWVKQGAAAGLRRFAAMPPAGGFEPKRTVALVTGTNRGIGKAVVEALAAAGVPRIYSGYRAGKAVAERKGIVPIELDIADPRQVAAAAERCSDVTLLVNNAGINFNLPLLAPSDPDAARKEIETNYLGTLAMCRAFAPILKGNGGGAIVNLLSILARVSLPAMGSLCASKAAGRLMTHALRAELKAQGTRVLGIMPGAVDTDMTRHLPIPKIQPAEVADSILDALCRGIDDVYPGGMAAGVAAGLAVDALGVEQEFAAYLPQ
jgi:2-keto-3-deoxy-L-rhamnonate aldolase RhmA/NAD(P)-dependent dehydrogenase (short-subunit alcohol dehydrogenase family)